MRPDRLGEDNSLLLVVDLQEKLLRVIDGAQDVAAAACKMIRGARIMGLPIIVTEQYPKGIGPTVSPVREALGDVPAAEKLTFSSCAVEPVRSRLAEARRGNVIVTGIEAHVCVQQTVLDLLALGHRPFVLADGVGSRRRIDYETSLGRMARAGAVVTTAEAVIFELLGEAGTDRFKQMLPVVK